MLTQDQTLPPGISKTPGVLGGEACIRSTRIGVWMVVRAQQLGLSDTELLAHYEPPLSEEDLQNAWSYYAAHRVEIDAAIRRNEDD